MILSFDKPKKLRSSNAHAEMYSSDTGIAGTYVPNMSETDKVKWKAKRIKGSDPRVEIRKTLLNGYAQVLLVVRADSITMSANGKMIWTNPLWEDLNKAVMEARIYLRCGHCEKCLDCIRLEREQ